MTRHNPIRSIFRSATAIALPAIAAALLAASCQKEDANVDVRFLKDGFAGKTLDLVTFNDSTVVASTEIAPDGSAAFSLKAGESGVSFPVLAQFMVDGRVKGYYVIEPGSAQWVDSTAVAQGTPLNGRFADLLSALDEADEAEDFALLTSIAEKQYNENKDNLFATYFGVEWLKWADPLKVDSLMAEAPAEFRDSKRAKRYIDFARLRARTAPGRPIADFEGEDAAGKEIAFSSLLNKNGYTLVDFMASWCPYCIKDMPKLKAIADAHSDGSVRLVSVAVRDTPEATRGAVERHGITWDVVYNAQKRPYDLYGFSGIPHYMLVDKEGVIVARSQSLDDISGMLGD